MSEALLTVDSQHWSLLQSFLDTSPGSTGSREVTEGLSVFFYSAAPESALVPNLNTINMVNTTTHPSDSLRFHLIKLAYYLRLIKWLGITGCPGSLAGEQPQALY